MRNVNKYTPDKINDWIIDCDICGAPCWYSEATTLSVETGRGGCLVCPRDADPIDYGLVPFKIRPEQPVRETRVNDFNKVTGVPGHAPFDYSLNPASTGDLGLWENIDQNWEDIDLNWEDV